MLRWTMAALFLPAMALAETRYEIDLAQAGAHDLAVTVEAECEKPECDFQMPVWNATYQVRDFAQYVTRFEATRTSGERLRHHLLTPSSWRVEAAAGERVRLRYHYLADGTSPFGCSASSRHVFLNFAQILVYPVDRLREPMSVRFRGKPEAWKIGLELPESGDAFRARNYDELADAPAELSAFAERAFSIGGKRVRVVVDAQPEEYDLGRLETTAQRIATAATEIMQDVPFASYSFIYHFRKDGRGGMEHANSTAIDTRAPCRDCTVAGVTAHEFFHLWNVKRIRPQSLEPIDYAHLNVTPSLWFCEGVTSTYGAYTLLQAGLQEPVGFLSRIESAINAYEQTPARLTQSAEESSISAWFERYPYYTRPGRSISYYNKGELAGYLLDLAIRHYSGNRRSLDDVMRRLNTEYARKGRFFEDTVALERLATEAAGHDMKPFFDGIIRRADPVDWDAYLGYAGYRLSRKMTQRPALGVETSRTPGRGWAVAELEPGGPGERGGLQPGDHIVSLNGRAIEGRFESALAGLNLKPGSRVTIEVDRGGRRQSLGIVPEFVRQTVFRLEEKPQPSEMEKQIGASWLRSRRNGKN